MTNDAPEKRCHLTPKQCPPSWTCRNCGARCCEHRCGLKVAEGDRKLATCGSCMQGGVR